MRSRFFTLFAATFILLATALGSRAQQGSGSITGRVTDAKDAVVAGVSVEARSLDEGRVFKATTNSDGIYVFSAMKPGRYSITVQKDGFQTSVNDLVVLHVEDSLTQNFKLQVGSVSEKVLVSGEAQMLQPEDAAIDITVDRRFVENLPLNGRSFQALIEMTPGVTIATTSYSTQGQFNINGMRSDANSFVIDGVSVNGGVGAGYAINNQGVGSLPNGSANGGFNNLVSVDAMQEFKIETSGFAAEYGRQPGGLISIVTRSGTNQFHGDVYDYLRNSYFDANDWFADAESVPKPGLRQNDFGGVVGGPIVKDKLFFFFSYEGLRLVQPQVTPLTSVVPSMAARNGTLPGENPAMVPLLNAFPVPTAPDGSGVAGGDPDIAPYSSGWSNPSNLNAYSFRGDWNINSKNTLFARYVNSPSANGQRTDANISWVDTGSWGITTGWTFIPKATVTNDLHFNFTSTYSGNYYTLDNFGGAVPLTAAEVWPSQWNAQTAFESLTFASYGSLDLGKNVRNTNYQYNILDTLAWIKGNHTIKFGGDYRQLRPKVGPRTYDQFLDFYNPLNLSDTTETISGVMNSSFVDNQIGEETEVANWSFFVQDSWKVTPRLTLTYGLRWEIDPPPSSPNNTPFVALNQFPEQDPAAITAYPLGHEPYTTTWANFAPRLGVAYQLSKDPRWGRVVRGGAGIFYDTGGDALGFNYGPYFQSNYLPSGAVYPLTATQAAQPVINTTPPYEFVESLAPNFKLPYAYHFNLQVEQQLGQNQTLSVAYVGSLGRKLAREQICLAPCAPTVTVAVTGEVVAYDNSGYSNYNSLQVVYQRRLSHGLQVLANWTYAHSLDDGSNFESGITMGAPTYLNYGNSDFDIRHTVNVALSYDIPSPSQNHFVKAILGGWGTDQIYRFRTSPPEDVVANYSILANGNYIQQRPDLVPGVPLYLYGSQYPGGRAWNPAAFTIPTDPTSYGDFGRNVLRGFPMQQFDMSFRRDFPLKLTEAMKLQFRVDMFNIFNHPNFAPPYNILYYLPQEFGIAQTMLNNGLGVGGVYGGYNPLYQVGGPRSMQFSLKVFF
jgi:hypothetical protein